MIPGRFEYHAPSSVSEAIALLAEYGDEAKILAGGHSLLPMMKLRFAEPEHLVDLTKVDELKGISEQGGQLVIGAMTTEHDLLESSLVQEKCPLIPMAARLIADPQVRYKGTIGGDIAHGDPGNDHPAIMLALDAQFVLVGPDGERIVAADDFFLGTYWTALEEGELLTQVRVPVLQNGVGFGFNKLKRKTGDFATAAATCALSWDGGRCTDIRISLTNVGPCAFRAKAAEDLLRDTSVSSDLVEQAVQLVMDACEPAEDLRGDIEYKTNMAGVMAQRSINQALVQAGGSQ